MRNRLTDARRVRVAFYDEDGEVVGVREMACSVRIEHGPAVDVVEVTGAELADNHDHPGGPGGEDDGGDR